MRAPKLRVTLEVERKALRVLPLWIILSLIISNLRLVNCEAAPATQVKTNSGNQSVSGSMKSAGTSTGAKTQAPKTFPKSSVPGPAAKSSIQTKASSPKTQRPDFPPGTPEFLWRVVSDKSTSYLIGTLHMVKGSFYPLPVEMEKAFDQARYLVLEIDLTKSEPTKLKQLLTSRGIYLPNSGDSLSKHISEETKKALNDYLTKKGIPASAFESNKPWLVALLITKIELEKHGYQPELGIDQHFLRESRAREKKVLGLETEEFQLGLLSSFSDELQDEMLRLNLLEVNELKQMADEMMVKWRSGDVVGMDAVLTKDIKKYPELMPVQEKMLYERNVDMAAKIEKMMETGDTYLIAVGSGHMVGDRGIVELLKKKGYKVEQIKSGMPLPPPPPPKAAPAESPSGVAADGVTEPVEQKKDATGKIEEQK